MSSKNSKLSGARAEHLAVYFLVKKGYEIVHKNYHSRYGEIDIIARKCDYIIFAEVKYRKNDLHSTPSMAVNFRKQEKIKKTALQYIEQNDITDKDFRFDIIEITGTHEFKINHIENAFN